MHGVQAIGVTGGWVVDVVVEVDRESCRAIVGLEARECADEADTDEPEGALVLHPVERGTGRERGRHHDAAWTASGKAPGHLAHRRVS